MDAKKLDDFAVMGPEKREDDIISGESDSPEKKTRTWDAQHAKRMLRLYRKTKDPVIKDAILRNYLGLARFYARKYAGRGVDYEDLRQEAYMGLLRAIERFDPSRGVEFQTYAVWFVEGWIRQYFRDKAWICKVPRSVKDMSLQIKNLSYELGRFPSREEAIECCCIPEERVDDAIAAAQTWGSISIHHNYLGTEVNPFIDKEAAYTDEELEAVITRVSIENAAQKSLDSSEAEIFRMYYFDDLTQREIALKLKTYQMMVSRSLQKSTNKLEEALSEKEQKAC